MEIKMIKLKEIIKEVQTVPKVGDFFEMGKEHKFDLVPIIRVNRKNKWIDIKHPNGTNLRVDFWNFGYAGINSGRKIWSSRMLNKVVKKIEEKYLENGKIFTAVRDLEDYDILKGDKVKIIDNRSNGYFDLLNLKTQKHISLYSLEFIKNFK